MAVTVVETDEGLNTAADTEAAAKETQTNGTANGGPLDNGSERKPESDAAATGESDSEASTGEIRNDLLRELRRRIDRLQAERQKWLKENRKRLAERNRLRDELRALEARHGSSEAGSARSGDGAGTSEAPSNNESEGSEVRVLETEMKRLAQERDALSQALEQEKVRSALLTALAAAGARHAQIAYRAADRSRLSVEDDGTVSGIDEAVEELREAIPELFEPGVPVNRPVLGGRKPRRADPRPSFTREDIRQIIRSGRWAQLRRDVLVAQRENRVIG